MASIIRATTTSGLQIAPDNSGSLQLQTNGTTAAVTIDTSQNVGIGVTPSPADLPTVENAYGLFSGQQQMNLATNAYYNSGWKYQGTGLAARYYVDRAGGQHIWYTAPSGTAGNAITFTERMRIDSNGNLLVGTASSASGNSNTFVTAGTTAADVAVFAVSTVNSNNVRCFIANANNYAGDSGYFFIGSRSGGDRVYILTSGNIQNSNNSYGAISDVKLKENIIDATPKLDDLMKVKVRNYNLKSEPDIKQIGVIAQELEEVFPGMIEENQDKDSDGNDLETTTKAVKYSVFVPMLIKAIQEQQTIINDLKARVETLEAK
jgi:hypothetical protein